MKRFRGVLVSEAHRRLYHSTLGSRVITIGRERDLPVALPVPVVFRGGLVFEAHILLYHSTVGSRVIERERERERERKKVRDLPVALPVPVVAIRPLQDRADLRTMEDD